MKKSMLTALAVMVVAWGASAQTAPSSPAGAAPGGQLQQPAQNVPIVPPGDQRSPQAGRGEDTGAQGQRVPVAGQQIPPDFGEHTLPANTPILAELTKKLEVKKLKPGEEVTARVVQDVLREGNVVIPHGARLVGHVTTVHPAAKGDQPSECGISWDRVETRRGESFPLHADIQALAAPQQFAENAPTMMGGGMNQPGAMGGPPMGPPAGGSAGTAGAPGGMGIPPGGQLPPDIGGQGGNPNAPPSTTPTSRQRGGSPVLNPRSTGVQGIPGVMLAPPVNPAQGSVVRDSRGNFTLPSGTQLVLRVLVQ